MEFIFNWIGENPIITLIIVLVLFLIFIYNNLNAKKKRVEKSFSTIDVYLEKRYDEIGALLEQLLKGYQFEENVQTSIAKARSGIIEAKNGSVNDKVSAINNLSGVLASPAIKTEAYPELKSISELALFTMQKTSSVESDIAAARIQYNSNATSYNTKISSFPNVLVAGIFGFKTPFELFKVSEGKKERPTFSNVKDNL